MQLFRNYWTFSAIRGALTIVVAGGIAIIPHFASAMLPVPFLMGLSVDVLAAYILLDCGALALLALMLPKEAAGRKVYYAQIASSVFVGAMLFAVVWGRADSGYVLFLAAFQAATAAVAEWVVARDTYRRYREISCYGPAAMLAGWAIVLPFLTGMAPETIVLGLAGYVGLFGGSQMLLGGEMLFEEYRAGHPAAVPSFAWRGMMQAAPLKGSASVVAGCGVCEICPAGKVCGDYSLVGQMTRIAAARVPAIVRAARVVGVLETALPA